MLQDRPTPEETDIIFRLRKAVSEAKECNDFFDVYDAIDAEEAGVPFEDSRCQKHFRRGEWPGYLTSSHSLSLCHLLQIRHWTDWPSATRGLAISSSSCCLHIPSCYRKDCSAHDAPTGQTM